MNDWRKYVKSKRTDAVLRTDGNSYWIESGDHKISQITWTPERAWASASNF
jgi:hypothetical protein